jgi:glycosyltransferase involved in cell wall biosynthesis
MLSDGNPTAPLLIYVGRLGDEKKIDRLTTVLDDHPSARLVIVGSGPSEEALKDVFASYASQVKFTGPLFGDDLSAGLCVRAYVCECVLVEADLCLSLPASAGIVAASAGIVAVLSPALFLRLFCSFLRPLIRFLRYQSSIDDNCFLFT